MATTDDLTLFFPALIHDRNKWLRPGLMSSDGIEWYTPQPIIKAVLAALGGIVDLDPCADPERSFPATRHYTRVENGLIRPWNGSVYMNPPYGRTVDPNTGENVDIRAWTTKLRDELGPNGWTTEAVALLPMRADTTWFHELHPPVLCLIRGRLRFSGYEQSAPFPSAAAYFGSARERFVAAFQDLGLIYDAAPV